LGGMNLPNWKCSLNRYLRAHEEIDSCTLGDDFGLRTIACEYFLEANKR